ncbi:hypothetical protein C5142_23640 [Rhodococcus sp. BGS-1C]|uniref:hypothetical protein n=1 Tax=unclassified Rhodococcus (in: high G+C Gram-positive bacteria) TaxID=192944 RepID=UPI003D160EC8
MAQPATRVLWGKCAVRAKAAVSQMSTATPARSSVRTAFGAYLVAAYSPPPM